MENWAKWLSYWITLDPLLFKNLAHVGLSSTFVFVLVFVSSDRSSCSDDGLVYIQRWQRPLFEIFTHSLDAIPMLQFSNDQVFQCSNVPLIHRSIGPLVNWSIGPLVHCSIGSLVHWTISPLDHWSIGQWVHWSIGWM